MQEPSSKPTTYERHGARAAVYSGLAGVFCYPDEETVAELTAPGALAGLAEAGETLGIESAVDSLRTALGDIDLDRLQTAHMELFGLPGDEGTYPVVPYEANYTAREDVGQQQRRIAKVAGAVEALGFEFDDAFDERHDHVAVELELMQVLAAWRAVAVRSADLEDAEAVAATEATLLDEHLIDFVPPLAVAIREATDHDLYVAAADVAETLVTTDHAARSDTPADGQRHPTIGGER